MRIRRANRKLSVRLQARAWCCSPPGGLAGPGTTWLIPPSSPLECLTDSPVGTARQQMGTAEYWKLEAGERERRRCTLF